LKLKDTVQRPVLISALRSQPNPYLADLGLAHYPALLESHTTPSRSGLLWAVEATKVLYFQERSRQLAACFSQALSENFVSKLTCFTITEVRDTKHSVQHGKFSLAAGSQTWGCQPIAGLRYDMLRHGCCDLLTNNLSETLRIV
jgi:hypothetical protein